MAESTTIVGMELICRAVLSDRLNVDETNKSPVSSKEIRCLSNKAS